MHSTDDGLLDFRGDIPPQLIRDIVEDKCVLFVGAGLSAAVRRSTGQRLPTWGALISELSTQLLAQDRPTEHRDIESLINLGKFLEAAEAVCLFASSEQLQECFEQIFGDPALRPSPTHLLIPEVRLRAVLTSNYDSLVEDAYEQAWAETPLTFTFSDYIKAPCPIRNGQFFVYKIHGDYRRIDTVTLSIRNYQALLHRNPGYRLLLNRIFAGFTVIFVGYGGTDPDLDDIIANIATLSEQSADPHYLLMPQGRFAALEKTILLSTKRLHIIEYDPVDEHQQVDAFLAEIAYPRVLERYAQRHQSIHILMTGHRRNLPRCTFLLETLRESGIACNWRDIDKYWTHHLLDHLQTDIELCDVVIHIAEGARMHFDMIPVLAAKANKPIVCLTFDGTGTPDESLAFSMPAEFDKDGAARLVELLSVLASPPKSDRRKGA